jgi:hypothetical protein
MEIKDKYQLSEKQLKKLAKKCIKISNKILKDNITDISYFSELVNKELNDREKEELVMQYIVNEFILKSIEQYKSNQVCNADDMYV